MLSITMKMMKKNLRMLIPAGIAILIGTAFIAATLLFTNAFDASLREQTSSAARTMRSRRMRNPATMHTTQRLVVLSSIP